MSAAGDLPRDRGKVLLAGGEGDELDALAAALAESGYDVVREMKLGDLESAFHRARPDTAIVGADGHEDAVLRALARLKSETPFRHVPVIVLRPESAGPAPSVEIAMTELVPAPVPTAQLLGRVRSNVEVKRLIDYGERKSERLQSLLEIGRALNSTLDSGAILYIIARKIAEAMDLVRCSFIVPDLTHGIGRVIACKDDPNIHALEINLANYPEIIQVLRTGRRVVISDVEQDPIMAGVRKFADIFRDQSIMTLPLQFHDDTVGVLQIRKKGQQKGFTPRELEYCELLANAAANALKNAQLYEDIEKHNYELRRQKRELEQLSGELRRKHEELLRLQQLKEDFTTMIVHDLRSPLMIVQGVLDLLYFKNRGNEEQKTLVEDGISVTKRMLSLVNNLLEVTKIESGEIQLNQEDIDVAQLLREAVEPYKVMAQRRRLELRVEAADGLESLRTDRWYLGQVLDNLLANAFKFTPDDGRVTVRAEAGVRAGEAGVTLVVEDTGPGIPADEIDVIFQKFRQGRHSHGRSGGAGGGTGLGLTIVDLLVKTLGGTVAVESTPGRGSAFRVDLPLRPGARVVAGVLGGGNLLGGQPH